MISNKLIEKECDVLRKSIKKKQRFVDEAPKGLLRCRQNRNHYNWFVVLEQNFDVEEGIENETENNSKKRTEKYIQKSDKKLAEKLAIKGMFMQDLLDEKQELLALETFMKKRSKFERREKFLSRSEGILELVESRLNCKWTPEVEAWLNEHIDYNVPNPDGRKFRCKNGLMVRSKSEQIIVNALFEHNVPFKYEEPIYLALTYVARILL